MVPPTLNRTTLSGHTFLERLEIVSDYFFLQGLFFLYPTGELHISVAIAETWDTLFLLSISHLLIYLLPPRAR